MSNRTIKMLYIITGPYVMVLALVRYGLTPKRTITYWYHNTRYVFDWLNNAEMG
jgi:hypothetical protein